MISQNFARFARQAKSCRRTFLGKKIAIQFHRHSVTLNQPKTLPKSYILNSPKSIHHLPNSRSQKSFSYSQKKLGENVGEMDLEQGWATLLASRATLETSLVSRASTCPFELILRLFL